MLLPFRATREGKAGFTLLETLIAFAIGTLVVSTGFVVVGQALIRQAQLEARLELSQFARATLTEYIVTHPLMAKSGTYGEVWSWKIKEQPLPSPPLDEIGLPIRYVDVTITVRRIGEPLEFSLSSAVARKK